MARVLIVIDGAFRFGVATGIDPDFTFTELVNALTAAGHQVTKAHRSNDGSPGVLQSFNFATTFPNLLDFDVIWLIGHAGRNEDPGSTSPSGAGIDEPQIAAIARFMAAGGGVFATGDHDSIGSEMCGRIPRVRAMRGWFGDGDDAPSKPANLPSNFPRRSAGRADTTQRSPTSDYGGDLDLVWFENQSDQKPQTIAPATSPAHPILRHAGSDIVVYPDHMHEGKVLNLPDDAMSYNYDQTPSFDGQSFVEFPMVAGNHQMPEIIATGQSLAHTTSYAFSNMTLDTVKAGAKPVHSLSVYEGRAVGVGRIVAGSTFHHYIDINLTGDTNINNATHADSETRAGADARKGHGYNDDPPTFEKIKAVFVNITDWLARPRPSIQLILERSTFSKDEAIANSHFDAAILVVVDGLKPNQFPGVGGVTSFDHAAFQQIWAPTITPVEMAGLNFVPVSVDSDDPMPLDRLQRLTFTYRAEVTSPDAFMFPDPVFHHVQINAWLTSAAVSTPLTDSAQITLVKGANPFIRDLMPPNETAWLNSDVKVFPVTAGAPGSGLADEATHQDAVDFLVTKLSTMTNPQFEGLTGDEEASRLSLGPRTVGALPHRKVYNFAIARVRLNDTPMGTSGIHIYFRVVPSPTTASLTYHQTAMGVPLGSYLENAGPNIIALPGKNLAGTEWWSFPCFLHTRMSPPESQTDSHNAQDFMAGQTSKFYGAVLDTNLPDESNYLPSMPSGMDYTSLSDLMMGEHQCIVVQIRYPGTPIPDGATPFTSDKLSQRNLAFDDISNPGLNASRMALHTFEIEATPNAISDGNPPDELLLQWRRQPPPEGTELHLEIWTWDAAAIVELADKFYPRHEIRALDAHTIAVPGGGTRYVPIPRSFIRQPGVITVHFPLGVKKRQRFDVSIHQVTTRGRQVNATVRSTKVSREEAAKLLKVQGGTAAVPRGVFELGDNKVLVTDLRVFDDAGDHAIIVEHPDPKEVARAEAVSGNWRETIGAFQLAIPVSDKAEMLPHYLQLLSVMRWRAERLRPNNRWYKTFTRYVELIAEKVRALGGDPYAVPPTRDGDVRMPERCEEELKGCSGCLGCILACIRRLFRGR
jgi:hypothetical protein